MSVWCFCPQCTSLDVPSMVRAASFRNAGGWMECKPRPIMHNQISGMWQSTGHSLFHLPRRILIDPEKRNKTDFYNYSFLCRVFIKHKTHASEAHPRLLEGLRIALQSVLVPVTQFFRTWYSSESICSVSSLVRIACNEARTCDCACADWVRPIEQSNKSMESEVVRSRWIRYGYFEVINSC